MPKTTPANREDRCGTTSLASNTPRRRERTRRQEPQPDVDASEHRCRIGAGDPNRKTQSRRQFRSIHNERSTLPLRTKALAAREDQTRETIASTRATAESTCEDNWAEQASPAKPEAEKHLPSRAGGQKKQ